MTLNHWIFPVYNLQPILFEVFNIDDVAVLWFSHTSSPWMKLDIYVDGPNFILVYFPEQYTKNCKNIKNIL